MTIDQASKPAPRARLPWWVLVADVLPFICLGLILRISIFGGFRFRIGSFRVLLYTWPRVAAAALVIVAVRHLLHRERPLHHRLRTALLAVRTSLQLLVDSTWLRRLPYVAAVAVFLLSIWQFHDQKNGFTSLIRFGQQFADRALPAVRAAPHALTESGGYDGQFYAQLAVDPLLRDRAILHALDDAPYRARRILFAWTAYLIGLGRPAWILDAYAVQNILAWLILAGVLLVWFPPGPPRHLVAWIGCLFGSGLLGSVTCALLECPSMLLLALAVLAIERNKSWKATVLIGLAGLGRETNLLGTVLLVTGRPRTVRATLSRAAMHAATFLPLVVWLLYLASRYDGIGTAGLRNFSIPGTTYVTSWATTLPDVARGGWDAPRLKLLELSGLGLQFLYLLVRWNPRNAWWRMGIGYAALMTVLGPAVWEGYPNAAAARVLVPMTFAFNVLIVKSRWYWPLAIIGNLSVVGGLRLLDVPWLSAYL